MKNLSEKGIVHIIPLLVVVGIIAAVGWFFYSMGGLEIGKTSIENKVSSLAPKPFKDISADNKNYKAISYLAKEEVLEADKDGNFNPKKTLTRGEWAVMLVKLAGVEPDRDKYKNCYSDVGKGETEAVICYAKEQGWFEGGSRGQTSWNFVKTANAQEDKENFNPDQPIINLEAAGSLARMMVWEPGKDPTNEEALSSANAGKILESQNAGGTLTRENAAGFVFRSLATVPFNRSEYEENFDNSVAKYSVSDLVNPRSEKGSSGPSREARINHWAENSGIGVETATSIVDSSSSYDEELKKVRQARYQRRLEEEKRATGQDLPSYDAFEPIKQIFQSRGGGLSKDDVLMKRGRFEADGEGEATSNSTINAKDNFEVRVMLDENYQVVPRPQWDSGKIKYVMEIFHHSFYDIGQTADFYLRRVKPNWAGQADITIIDYESGVADKAAVAEKWYRLDSPEGLQAMYRDIFKGIESEIGQEIAPAPAVDEESENTPSSEDAADVTEEDEWFPEEWRGLINSSDCPGWMMNEDKTALWCFPKGEGPGPLELSDFLNNVQPSYTRQNSDFSSRDCWKEFSDGLQRCLEEATQCNIGCGKKSNDQNVIKPCLKQCSAAADACRAPVREAYDPCVEARRQGQ